MLVAAARSQRTHPDTKHIRFKKSLSLKKTEFAFFNVSYSHRMFDVNRKRRYAYERDGLSAHCRNDMW